MAVSDHQSNRPVAGDDDSIFENDLSSKNEVARRKREAELAATNAKNQAELAQKTEAERVANEEARAKELKELREGIEALKGEKTALQREKSTLEGEKRTLQGEKSALESEKTTLQNYKTALESRAMNAERSERELKSDIQDKYSLKLDWGNDLPPEWHRKTVMLINVQGRTALDCGASKSLAIHTATIPLLLAG